MHGIWLLSTQLSGSLFRDSASLARIVFNVIFIPGIGYVVYAWLTGARKPRQKGQGDPFDLIGYGATALLMWYILNTIDLFLHESQMRVKYIYIIYYFFLACLKFPADILILAGSHSLISGQLYIHHHTPTPKPKVWFLAGEFLVLVLAILALYYIGSLIAYEALWLQVADSSTVLSVRSKRNKLEAAFFGIQLVVTLLTLAAASSSIWLLRKRTPILALVLSKKPKRLTTVFAASLLVIRSILELTVVVRYHLFLHPYARSTLPSRDLIYGLTTLGFLLLIPSTAREIASAEAAETTDPLLAEMEEDTRRFILREVENYKSINGGRVPNMIDVLSNVRNNFARTLWVETTRKVNMVRGVQRTALVRRWEVYVGSLETKYAGLQERDRSREF